MKTISRYLMTLALLITAATSAWAQTETLLTTITATGQTTYSESTAGVVTVSHDNDYFDNTFGWLWYEHAGSVTVEAKDGYTITRCVFSQPYKTPFTVSTAPFKVDFIETSDPDMPEFKQYLCQGYMDGVSSIEVYGYAAPAGPAVTIADGNGEASFEMPTNDVTVNYELVRDMSVQMQAQVGDDATKQPRYRVQWNDEKDTFEPAEMDMMQVLELFSVYDGIEGTTLAPKNYRVNIWAVDNEGNPTGDAMNFTNFTFAPGRYCVTASALLDAPYDGTTAPSNIFELFQGYQVVIPAGEYVTYYKDEALYVEDEDAKLYTITTVGNETATATELTVAAANTPLLVKNNAAEAKTILLIPTTSATPDEVTPYEGFKGTLAATQIAASTATQNNYALNGKEFVWVMEAIDIAANRAWLEVPAATTNGRALQIVFGDVTGMTPANIAKAMNGDWYTLDGMKLQAAPTKKGVYILNGKKVIVP